jgi:membrane-associated protease RseP (regulator of RpoE activity)
MNCQSFKNQIDEAAFTAELNRHLEACSGCKTFREERECLSRLLTGLEHINAPTNFEFGVRAKLNSLPAINGNRVWVRRFAFASPALAAVAVSAFVFTNYNVFSPNIEQTPVAIQSSNPAPIANPLPVVSPTQQILATTNSNLSTETPIMPKQTLPAPNPGKQVATGNASIKQHKSPVLKTDKEAITGKDVDEPKRSGEMALRPAATPLIQDDFKRKVAASQVLSIFGIEKISDDGTVESVGSNSAAAEKGILPGDRIETVNGQKFAGADLDNSFRQMVIGILRNGKKSVITLDLPQPK